MDCRGGIQSTSRDFDCLLYYSNRWTWVIWVQMQVAYKMMAEHVKSLSTLSETGSNFIY